MNTSGDGVQVNVQALTLTVKFEVCLKLKQITLDEIYYDIETHNIPTMESRKRFIQNYITD